MHKGCGSWDRAIGMKGTGKGCGSSGDGVTRCGQRDKGYWQTLGTGCCKVKGTDIGSANDKVTSSQIPRSRSYEGQILHIFHNIY